MPFPAYPATGGGRRSCPCPLLASALDKVGPKSHRGITAELTPLLICHTVVWVGERCPPPKSCRLNPAGSPWHSKTIGYPRGVSVRSQHQIHSRNQRLRTRSMILCNEHFQVRVHGQKGLLCDTLCHTSASMIRFSFFFLLNCILLEGGTRAQGRYERWKNDAWCER